jgi:phosphoribosylformylglycinamidine synthase II
MSQTMLTLTTLGLDTHQVFWIEHEEKALTTSQIDSVRECVVDSIDQKLSLGFPEGMTFPAEVVCFKPGVTDNPAKSFKELLLRQDGLKDKKIDVHSGLLRSSGKLDFNSFIHSKVIVTNREDFKNVLNMDFSLSLNNEILVQEYQLEVSDEALTQLSEKNCWALSLKEMKIIQDHFKSLKRNPTDVEMEMLAQTWSEHCKHKIFNARIDYQDSQKSLKIESLFKEFIKQPTYDLNKSWAISVFDDNAGVVRFREGMDLCIKVETHNSPSALDPYGGALTGILGVNRDIMGTGLGAKPVANTNVFCVGMPNETELPETLLHPREILSGIHRGVKDGGNKSGIPTVNGAIYFDESYSGKPLVYCGTVGVLPQEIQGVNACHKGQRPDDLVVMVGGAVGIDGIHGATASSLVMDKTTTLGMVQIGDPFSQKRMLDFLLVARDKLLYNSLTDNGAGGLSSSIGEMSQATGGAIVHLDRVPLKYPGLTPWQILVSESQERMTLSVPKEKWVELEALAELYQVPVTAVGTFTNDGIFNCQFNGKTVCSLELNFLHDGLPKMELKARYSKKEFKSWKPLHKKNFSLKNTNEILTELLSHPTISSKEKWVRQYDHEVQGATVVKPFQGLQTTAPNDAGVLWYEAYGAEGNDGFAVASGRFTPISNDDCELMAKLAVDEAVRNLICHGADPDKIALVDNFCWPDPIPSEKNPDAEYKLAQLVRTCIGLREMVKTYGMPLVSGKDSMKNDYHGEKVKISVLPTLLVTAIGHVPDVRNLPRSQVKAGELLYRLGSFDYQSYFGHFLHNITTLARFNNRDFDWKNLLSLYHKIFRATENHSISSLHDISEGGFLVSLFESLLMNKSGITLNINPDYNRTAFLFSELPGHFIVSVDPSKKEIFEHGFSLNEIEYLGVVNDTGVIKIERETLSINELEKAWRSL